MNKMSVYCYVLCTLKTLFNIVEVRFNKVLNFDVLYKAP